MRRFTVTRVSLLFALVLVGGPSSKSAFGQPAPEEGLQTVQALVMIVGNPLDWGDQLNSLDSETRSSADDVVSQLIRNTYLRADKPEEEFLEKPVSFYHLSVTRDGHTLGTLVASGRGEMAKVLATAQMRLQEALLEIHRLGMEPLDRKIALAESRMHRASAMTLRVTEDLKELRAVAQQHGQALEPQDAQLFASVKRDDLAMRAELAGLQAQREAIIEQLAKTKAELDDVQDQQRPVLDQLAQVVKLHEDELAATRKLAQKGFVSPAEVSKVEVVLAQARAELADRRRVLVKEAGGGQLGRLNEQLVDTQIAITSTEARLSETDKALKELETSTYNPVNSLVVKYQRARRSLENAWAEEEAAAAELAKLKMTREAIPAPKVIAIRGEKKPE